MVLVQKCVSNVTWITVKKLRGYDHWVSGRPPPHISSLTFMLCLDNHILVGCTNIAGERPWLVPKVEAAKAVLDTLGSIWVEVSRSRV